MKIKKFIQFIARHLNLTYSLSFIVLSSLLLYLLIFEKASGIVIKKTELHENRAYSEFPDLATTELTALPEKIENYFNDNLPLRNQIIYKYHKLLKNFHVSIGPVKGKNNHYFKKKLIDNYIGKNPLKNEIKFNILTFLTGMQELCNLYHGDYYTFLFPDKTVIYPEFIPNLYHTINPPISTQLTEFLTEQLPANINFTNFCNYLKKHKNPKKPYFNKLYDINHWNGNGIAEFYNYLNMNFAGRKNFTTHNCSQAFSLKSKARKVKEAGFDQNETVPWVIINPDGLQVLPNPYKELDPDTENWYDTDIIINDKVKDGTILMRIDSYLKDSHQNTIKGSAGKIFPLAHNTHRFISTHYNRNSFKFIKQLLQDYSPEIIIDAFAEREIGNFVKISTTNREFFVAGELTLNPRGFFLTPKILIKNNPEITSISNHSNEAISFKITDNSSPLRIPELKPDANGRSVIMAKVYSPIETEVTLYYTQIDNSHIFPFKTKQRLLQGINYVYIPIYGEKGSNFRLNLDFKAKQQTYIIFPKPTVKEIFIEDK